MGHRVDTESNNHPPTDRPETYRIHHDINGAGSLAEALVVHLNKVTDVDLMSSEELLSDYIDPDALDALFATPKTDPENNVQFSFAGHRITVYATGHIYIET